MQKELQAKLFKIEGKLEVLKENCREACSEPEHPLSKQGADKELQFFAKKDKLRTVITKISQKIETENVKQCSSKLKNNY